MHWHDRMIAGVGIDAGWIIACSRAWALMWYLTICMIAGVVRSYRGCAEIMLARDEKAMPAVMGYARVAAVSMRVRISATAVAKPTNKAWAMIAWPMLSSLMPGMAAMGSTLW